MKKTGEVMNKKSLSPNITSKKQPIIALCYDFDKTLSPKDMQEYGFIDSLGMTAEDFWSKSDSLAKNHGMDMILAYMYSMTLEAERNNIKVTENDLKELGKDIELFDGVTSWFDRINSIAHNNGAIVEHYIISSGLKEIIEGSEIAYHFKDIYASSFHYNEKGRAIWPKQAVNFTTKTQYLFLINKNCESEDVNRFMPDDERRIPFTNFIYIGDSDTDIPCMRLVKTSGGNSVGVYNPADIKAKQKVQKLLCEKRINYYAPCDYTENGPLEQIITMIIKETKARHDLQVLASTQIKKLKSFN